MATDGEHVFQSQGPRVLVVDRLEGLVIGRSQPLPGHIDVMHYAKGHLFVGVSHHDAGMRIGGMAVLNVSDPRRPQFLGYEETEVWYQGIVSKGDRLWASGNLRSDPGFGGNAYRTGMEIWDIENAARPNILDWVELGDPTALTYEPLRIALTLSGDFVFAGYQIITSDQVVISAFPNAGTDLSHPLASKKFRGLLDFLGSRPGQLIGLGRQGHFESDGRYWVLTFDDKGQWKS